MLYERREQDEGEREPQPMKKYERYISFDKFHVELILFSPFIYSIMFGFQSVFNVLAHD